MLLADLAEIRAEPFFLKFESAVTAEKCQLNIWSEQLLD